MLKPYHVVISSKDSLGLLLLLLFYYFFLVGGWGGGGELQLGPQTCKKGTRPAFSKTD